MSYSLPYLFVSGTNYEVGKLIGIEFKQRIHKFIENYNDFNSIILPFIKSINGKQILDDYSHLIKQTFPYYWDEILGTSEGCGIDFDWILALNLSVELVNLATGDKETSDNNTKQCTDLFLITDEHNFLLHNEDADLAIYNTCYMVNCKIVSSEYNGVKSPEEEFTAYCYPGNLSGNAFGFNSNGFVFGVNTLYSNQIMMNKMPHQLITRSMVSSKSLKDFEDKITLIPIAYGVSVNLGFFGNDLELLKSDWNSEYKTDQSKLGNNEHINQISFNYEIAPSSNDSTSNIVSKHCVIKLNSKIKTSFYSNTFYAHVNCYERIKTVQIELKLQSSWHRKEAILRTKIPENLKDLLDLASNDCDKEFPIFRTPRLTDQSQTVATGFFKLFNLD